MASSALLTHRIETDVYQILHSERITLKEWDHVQFVASTQLKCKRRPRREQSSFCRLCVIDSEVVFSTSLQEVEDMRNCYDGLISAAAATTNSVYGTDGLTSDVKLFAITQLCRMFVTECLLAYAEFSEALEELGGCFLAKTALNGDDDDSGKHI